MDRFKTLFGEPAMFIGVLEAILAFALTLTSLDTTTQGVIMTFAVALGGIWGAWATQTTLQGALVAVIKAGAVLAVTFHYSFSETSQATLIAVITAALGWVYRSQTTPAQVAVGATPPEHNVS